MQEEVPSPTLIAGGGLRNLSGQNLVGVLKAGALNESVLTMITVSIAPNATSVFMQVESAEVAGGSVMASQKLGNRGCHWAREALYPRNRARVMGHDGIECTALFNIGPLLISPGIVVANEPRTCNAI